MPVEVVLLRIRLSRLCAAALALIAVVIALQIVVNSGRLQSVDPTTRLAWKDSARQTTGYIRYGESLLAAPADNAAALRSAALAALSNRPLSSDSLFLLGAADAASGSVASAAPSIEKAGELSLRNTRAHLWLYDYELSNRNFAAALAHLDLVLRLNADIRPDIISSIAAMGRIPEGRAALVAALEQSPPWRRWLLQALPDQAGGEVVLRELYKDLNAGPQPITPEEMRPYLLQLVRDQKYQQAYNLWRARRIAMGQDDRRYLRNGDFSAPISGVPFEWRMEPAGNFALSLTEDQFSDGKRLQLQFGFGVVAPRYISQMLLLPPGTYRFSAKVETDDVQLRANSLGWVLRCLDKPRQLAASPTFSGTTARTEISVTFTVPSNDCRAQQLRLEAVPQGGRSAGQNGGIAYFDSLKIERQM